MNEVWKAFQKYITNLWHRCVGFMRKIFGGRDERRADEQTDVSLKPIIMITEDSKHSKVHVRFANKPEPGRPKIERRQTSGKALLNSPMNSSDEDEDVKVSIQSLMVSSKISVITNTDKLKTEKACEQVNKNIERKLEVVVGAISTEVVSQSLKDRITKLIKLSPNATDENVEEAYLGICQEVPFFKNISSRQVFQIIKDDVQRNKELPPEEAFENLMAQFKI